jgi:hypothetical protein
MWRGKPLLCNDREISKYTTAVYRQRLIKHLPAVTDTHITIEVLLETVFAILSVVRDYKEDKWGKQVSSVRESEASKVHLEGSRRPESTDED